MIADIDMAGVTGIVTAVGVAIVAVITALQRKTLKQVEKQGNSRDLESKRVVAMVTRRLAAETGKAADIAIAEDAEQVYHAAMKSTQDNL